MDKFQKAALAQLDVVEARYKQCVSADDGVTPAEFGTVCVAAVSRISGESSTYSKHAQDAADRWAGGIISAGCAGELYSICRALRSDVEAGFLTSFAELIHADLFADYVEMAAHLVSEGYKDAAAVIAGSTLESHLRQLCTKNSVSLTEVAPNGDVRPQKTERLNQELVKAGVYNKLRAKQVTSWLDLRNKAAHGEYGEYTEERVKLYIDGIRDFMASLPA